MKKLSILLVDDARDFAEILVWHLRDSGHNVVYAPDGREGAAELRNAQFDLVITDIIMPVSDGFELIATVKKTQPTARILAISGGGALYSAQACLQNVEQHGADGVLLKPFGPAKLTEEVQRLFPD
jgi:CheY-like chemotaxis protein